jgi:hypothetical protein
VKLPDDDPQIFNIYVNWIYHRHVTLYPAQGYFDEDEAPKYRALAAYMLSDKLLDDDFNDAVCDALGIALITAKTDGSCWVPSVSFVAALYDQTQLASKLRKLFVHDICSYGKNDPRFDPKYNLEFLFDCAVCAHGRSKDGTCTAVAKCAFHEHDNARTTCYRNKYSCRLIHSFRLPAHGTQLHRAESRSRLEALCCAQDTWMR